MSRPMLPGLESYAKEAPEVSPTKQELNRRQKRADKLHAALLEAGETGILNHEMQPKHGILSYSSGLEQLRTKGFKIQSECVNGGDWRYWIAAVDREPTEAEKTINRREYTRHRKVEALETQRDKVQHDQGVAQRKQDRATARLAKIAAELNKLNGTTPLSEDNNE
jgi:hypothetical protein